MKIQITFQEKHLCYIGKFLEDKELRKWTEVNDQIIAALNTPDILPETLCTVEVEVSKLVELYVLLGFRQEREATKRNGEMKTLLMPQLQAMLQSEDPNLINIAANALQQISTIEQANNSELEAKEDAYRQWAKTLRN